MERWNATFRPYKVSSAILAVHCSVVSFIFITFEYPDYERKYWPSLINFLRGPSQLIALYIHWKLKVQIKNRWESSKWRHFWLCLLWEYVLAQELDPGVCWNHNVFWCRILPIQMAELHLFIYFYLLTLF